MMMTPRQGSTSHCTSYCVRLVVNGSQQSRQSLPFAQEQCIRFTARGVAAKRQQASLLSECHCELCSCDDHDNQYCHGERKCHFGPDDHPRHQIHGHCATLRDGILRRRSRADRHQKAAVEQGRAGDECSGCRF